MGKYSLAQTRNWKFFTDAHGDFELFLSPSRFCLHARRQLIMQRGEIKSRWRHVSMQLCCFI